LFYTQTGFPPSQTLLPSVNNAYCTQKNKKKVAMRVGKFFHLISYELNCHKSKRKSKKLLQF
jgi:hypothetical protein